MRAALRLFAEHRQPMIKFLGKRKPPTPASIDHTPHAHPASPTDSLPDSFANYRSRATQHGPMAGGSSSSSASSSSGTTEMSKGVPMRGPQTYGLVGGKTGRQLGAVKPKEGEYFDRSELPARFRTRVYEEAEIDAVQTAGASMWDSQPEL